MKLTMDWRVNCPLEQTQPEWGSWFATPGDADDFIFYWEEQNPHSEK